MAPKSYKREPSSADNLDAVHASADRSYQARLPSVNFTYNHLLPSLLRCPSFYHPPTGIPAGKQSHRLVSSPHVLHRHYLQRLAKSTFRLSMASLLRAYNAALIRRPMLYQCATAGVLFAAGDVIAQQAFEKRGMKHDFIRTARLGFYGGCLFGPILSKWIQFLNRLQFKTPVRAVMYRTYLDQGVFTPGVVAFFFGSMSILEGKGISDAAERISENYTPTLIRNWGVFVPAQIINFALVPHHLRFVFVGVVSLFWNTYLSSVNAHKSKETEAIEAVPATTEEKVE